MPKIILTVALSEAELKDANVATARVAGLAAVNNAGALQAAACTTDYTPQAGTFAFDLSPPAAASDAPVQAPAGPPAKAPGA